MELYKSEYSKDKGKGKLDKVLLKCRDYNYYKLVNFLYTSQKDQAIILKALFYCDIDVVLKFNALLSNSINLFFLNFLFL